MRVFLSYASEDRLIADETRTALAGRGHDVFFDRKSLKPATDYHTALRDKIYWADVFVFLISPSSIARTAYTLTEIDLADNRWGHPKGRVLPVLIVETPWDKIPPFLKGVSVYEPKGNVAAEIAEQVDAMTRTVGPVQWSVNRSVAVALVTAVAIAFGLVGWYAGGWKNRRFPLSIAWNTDAQIDNIVMDSQEHSFSCPAAGTSHDIWAADDRRSYGFTSSICTAAVHAGVLQRALGGPVRVRAAGVKSTFIADEQNGIKPIPAEGDAPTFSFVK
jgi:hypothetical protein